MSQVLLVCNPLLLIGLIEVWKIAAPDLKIAVANKLGDVRAALRNNPRVRVLTLDMAVPDCGGLLGVQSLHREFPDLRVVLLSADANRVLVEQAAACGASGVIPKSMSFADAAEIMKNILSGGSWLPRHDGQGNDDGKGDEIASLPPAQLRVLMGLQRGLRNKQIAFELGVSEKTVKACLTVLFRKLGVSSRAEALIRMRDAPGKRLPSKAHRITAPL
jgi:DNA-binding NarL/FixJ family response regulator